MSKKLASGSDTILLDVKYGSGAFMKTLEQGRELARLMVNIGNSLGRDTRAILTNMDQPLGLAIGNNLEVKEAVATLHGHGPHDFSELCKRAAAIMLEQAKIVKDQKDALSLIEEKIKSGEAFAKFREMVKAQGGDLTYIDDLTKFPVTKNIIPVLSTKEGYVEHIDSLAVGVGGMKLGAGRATVDDVLDMSAGIILNKKVGDFVKKGETLATLYSNKESKTNNEVLKEVHDAYLISKEKIGTPPIISDYIK